MNKLNIKAFAVALGITWAIGAVLLAWMAAFGWGEYLVDVISSVYIGYKATFIGSIIGGLWAFFDAGVTGAIIAFIYNKCLSKEESK